VFLVTGEDAARALEVAPVALLGHEHPMEPLHRPKKSAGGESST